MTATTVIASLIDNTTTSGNLLSNSTFTAGTYTSNGNANTPASWTYANIYGATYGGGQTSGGHASGSNAWSDGAVQAYDAISQTVGTTVGDSYTLSFYAYETNSLQSNFSRLSTNGGSNTAGNGTDILAYAQAGLPPASVPEPPTLPLLGVGLLAMAVFAGRRRSSHEGDSSRC